jgi:hypothetical protein
MDAFTHVGDAVDEYCEQSDVTHAQLESLGNSLLTEDGVRNLASGDDVVYAEAVSYMPGKVVDPSQAESNMTTTFVVSTTDHSRLVHLFGDAGWVVVQEWYHDDDEEPAAVAEELVSAANVAMVKDAETVER